MGTTTRWAAAFAAALLTGCGAGGGSGAAVPRIVSAPSQPGATSQHDAQLQPQPANASAAKITEYYNPQFPADGGVTRTPDGSVWFTAISSSQQAQIVQMRDGGDRAVAIPPLPSAVNGMNVQNTLVSSLNGRVWVDVATFGATNGPGGQPLEDDRFVYAVDGAAVTQPVDGIDTGNVGTAGVAGVTTDAHGDVWFSSPSSIFYPGSEFGSIAQSGNDATAVSHYFVAPTLTGAIAVMPNGEIWIAGLFALPSWQMAIGRYRPDGTWLGTVRVPSSYRNVTDAVVGSDGAYWYTDGTQISRATLRGTSATYTVPSATPNISSMTLAGDGAIWFTESGSAKVGRITTNGVVTEYSLPSSNAQPMQIVGPHNSACGPSELWIAEAGTGKIARLTIAP